jgi:hypothetical protein
MQSEKDDGLQSDKRPSKYLIDRVVFSILLNASELGGALSGRHDRSGWFHY